VLPVTTTLTLRLPSVAVARERVWRVRRPSPANISDGCENADDEEASYRCLNLAPSILLQPSLVSVIHRRDVSFARPIVINAEWPPPPIAEVARSRAVTRTRALLLSTCPLSVSPSLPLFSSGMI